MEPLIVIFIFILLLALSITQGNKKIGAAESHKRALMVGCGDYQFWVLQEKIAAAGFSVKNYTPIPSEPIPQDYYDFIRIDTDFYTGAHDNRFLSAKCAFMNKFDRENKRPFATKHLLDKFLAGKKYYPRGAMLDTIPPGVWIARPSTLDIAPGISTWKGHDLFILHDDESAAAAREIYKKNAELIQEITPGNEYAVSVIEYIRRPLLINGTKSTLMMYLISGAGENITPFCGISDIGFFKVAESPYIDGEYSRKDIHYTNRAGGIFPADLPDQSKIKMIQDQLRQIADILCPLAKTLRWTDTCRGAYEMFMIELLIDEDYKLWLLGVSDRLDYPTAKYDDPKLVLFTKTLAEWEMTVAIRPLMRCMHH